MSNFRLIPLPIALALLAIAAPAAVRAQDAPKVPAAQAQKGEQVYRRTCLACHANADFTKHEFTKSWDERPLFELVEGLKATMPEDAPGSLSAQEYLDVVLYIFKMNGAPEGEGEIKTDESTLKSVKLKMKHAADALLTRLKD